MKSSYWIPIAASLFLASTIASAAPAFAPLQQWKAAVMAGDKAALAQLYSMNPPAILQVGKDKVGLNDELQFWAGLPSSGVAEFNPKVLELNVLGNRVQLLLRIEAVKTNQSVVASMVQIWTEQPDGWRIISTGRNDFAPAASRRLPQPAVPNTSLYSAPAEAQAELNAALAAASREHKRVLVMFGANWCYDCHVFDATFHSKDFATLVNDNYVVAHINIGEEGKDNNDLATRLGVVLDHGIPSLAILNSDGSVVVAQKSGEFESTVKIGPEDVRAFLEKWKLAAAVSLDLPALPDAAKAIAVIASSDVQLKFHFLATGKQIYKCENGTWSKGPTPDATLYDANGNAKIHHSAGPSWTMLDGTGSIKAIGATAVHFTAPDGASIDWLKLDVDKTARTGAFSDVGAIQRLYTGAGKAPATGCSPNQTYESPYTAHYYFWTSK